MAYKSMLTFASSELGLAELVASASALAQAHDAHLEISCLGIDVTQSMGFYAGAPSFPLPEMLDQARASATRLEELAHTRMQGAGLRWSSDSAIVGLGGINGYVGLKARFADLVILPRPYGDGRGPQDEAITEAALFDGAAPTLILPKLGATLARFGKVVLAWNQSDEALAATRKALPLLQAADLVNIVVIDPPSHGYERSDPGGMLAQMLARHGVQTDVSVLAQTMPRTSDILRRHCLEVGADLLVMGAYGHSRLRQAILGGTTRNLLTETEIPVFMAR